MKFTKPVNGVRHGYRVHDFLIMRVLVQVHKQISGALPIREGEVDKKRTDEAGE